MGLSCSGIHVRVWFALFAFVEIETNAQDLLIPRAFRLGIYFCDAPSGKSRLAVGVLVYRPIPRVWQRVHSAVRKTFFPVARACVSILWFRFFPTHGVLHENDRSQRWALTRLTTTKAVMSTNTKQDKTSRSCHCNETTTPFIDPLFSSSLLIFQCPSRSTTNTSTLPSPLHTTATVIQSLTSVPAGSTKTSPSTLQANRRETRSQPAATVQHRSDLLRIPRRHQHCDKHSTIKYECNGRANTSD